MTDPQVVNRPAFWVLGVVRHFAGPESADFEGTWRAFGPQQHLIEPLSCDGVFYGVGFVVEGETGFDYFAGMAVPEATEAPPGLFLREVSAATEAVFACTMATIGATFQFAYGEWMARAGYQCAEPLPWFERYPPEGISGPDSPLEIHIAIKPVGA
jgi:predicted transcriptional regulator YdeE